MKVDDSTKVELLYEFKMMKRIMKLLSYTNIPSIKHVRLSTDETIDELRSGWNKAAEQFHSFQIPI